MKWSGYEMIYGGAPEVVGENGERVQAALLAIETHLRNCSAIFVDPEWRLTYGPNSPWVKVEIGYFRVAVPTRFGEFMVWVHTGDVYELQPDGSVWDEPLLRVQPSD